LSDSHGPDAPDRPGAPGAAPRGAGSASPAADEAESDRFGRDTAVRATGDGRYEARIDPGWFVVNGPNGGYVAAIVLRALQHAVGDPERAPRSLTLHYTAPPAEGPIAVETRIERSGRSLTTASARLVQDGRLTALAVAALSRPREVARFDHSRMPEAPPPEDLAPAPHRIPMNARYETRFAPGSDPDAGSDLPRTLAWIRPAEPRALDFPLLAAYTDALPPPVLVWRQGGTALGPLPTVDLTLHFRAPLPHGACGPGDFCLAAFRSRVARDGFVEEDGEVWSRDGVLLAQSRQLAVVLGPPAG